jgi:competence protein ComFB
MSNENGIEKQSEKTASIKLSPRQERSLRKVLSNQKYRVINVVEIIARDNVPGMMDRMDMCTCSKCACDVLAIALNALPTKYVTTDAGKQYIQLQTYKKQFETDVEIALMRACLTVKEAPNHDEPENG